MKRATVSVQAYGKRGKNGRAVSIRMAVERFLDMLEARLHRHAMPWQQCQLRRAAGETFERSHAVRGGKLPDRLHPGMNVEG